MSSQTAQPNINRRQRTQLAARSEVDERTIHRYLLGRTKPHAVTLRAIHEAARSLGIDLGVTP